MAGEKGQIELLHLLNKLWECAEEVLTHEELKFMFVAKEECKRTAWHRAAGKGQIDILHKLWDWAKKVLTKGELNNMFLAKEECKWNAWLLAAGNGQTDVLHKLWEWAK